MKRKKVTVEQKLIDIIKVRIRGCLLEQRIWGARDISEIGVGDRMIMIKTELDSLRWVLSEHERILDELKCHGELLPVHSQTVLNMNIDMDGDQ